jgi:PAS domain S-box-containing protein
MRWIDDLSIRTKVLIVPLVLVLTLLVVSGLAFYGLREQNTLVKATKDIALKKIDLIDQFIILSEQVQSDVFQISILRLMNLPPEEIQPALTRLAQGLNDLMIIYGELQIRRQLTPQEVVILKRLKPPLEAFRRQAQQAAMVVMDNPSFGALLVRGAMEPFAEFRKVLTEFLDYQKNMMVRMSIESQKKAQISTIIIITLVLLIGLASTFITFWFSTRLISAPIAAITVLMRRLADGDLSVEVAGRLGRDEIGEMARAVEVFRHNALQKEQLDSELRQKEERYRLLFQQTPAAVYHYDTGLRLTDCNQRLAAIFQSTTQQLIGLDLNTLEDQRVLPALRAALEGREGFYQGPYQATAGPAEIWVSIHTAPVLDPQGRVKGGISLGEDITERQRAEEALQEKDQELERRNEELTRFTYAVSHDLKSPLVTIKTFLGYLEQDAQSQNEERSAQDLAYIRNATDKMSQLLDELLDLSRVGRVIHTPVTAPLQGIVQEALDLVAGHIIERGAQIQVTEEPVLLYGDRPRLVEVFQNLVDNAVKFMGDQPSPRIEIGVEEAGGDLVLFVRDNGDGIDQRYQPKLFGLFEKLDPRTEGVGIGLCLVQRIVEVHGGRIWVESEGAGKGACFRFTLAGARKA